MSMDHPLFILTTSISVWWDFEILSGFECLRDVGDLLMMIMSFLKTIVCREFCHKRLIFTSTIATCVVDVWDHSTYSNSIRKLASTFVCLFLICHEFFDTYKTIEWILHYMLQTWIHKSNAFLFFYECNM